MNYNYNLAKVNADGTLEYAPTEFINVGGLDIIDPMGTYARTQNFLDVVDTPMPAPKAGVMFVSKYEARDGKAVRVWTETALPEPVEPPPNPYEERLTALETELTAAKKELEILKAAQDEQAELLTALDGTVKANISAELPVEPVEPIEIEKEVKK